MHEGFLRKTGVHLAALCREKDLRNVYCNVFIEVLSCRRPLVCYIVPQFGYMVLLLEYESVGVRLQSTCNCVAVAQTILNLRTTEREEYISNAFF